MLFDILPGIHEGENTAEKLPPPHTNGLNAALVRKCRNHAPTPAPGTWALGMVDGLGDDESSGQKLPGRTHSCKHQARALETSEVGWAGDRDGAPGLSRSHPL